MAKLSRAYIEHRAELAEARVVKWTFAYSEAEDRAASYRRADKVREWEAKADRAAERLLQAETEWDYWLSLLEPEEEEPEEIEWEIEVAVDYMPER